MGSEEAQALVPKRASTGVKDACQLRVRVCPKAATLASSSLVTW